MFKLLAIEFGNDLTVFGHFHIQNDGLHGCCSRIRIFAAIHIQFGFLVANGYDTVDMRVEFSFTFLRRSERCATETRSYTMDLSFVHGQFTLPMYVFLFTIPTKINFNFATYRITFRGNRSQRAIHAS